MIKKLDKQHTLRDIFSKINELVDAVSELQKHEEQHLDLLTQLNEMRLQNTKKTEPTDPYVEQRKWIGKLCKFRDNDIEEWRYGILCEIRENETEFPFYRNDHSGFGYCEPVKPDDDIIYKGE